MALSMKSATVRVVGGQAAARPARASVIARAENVDRRGAMLGVVGLVAAAIVAPQQASAIELPWQESTGGMLKGKGNMTKSPTGATAEGYTLEGFPGTKKPSYLEPKKKKNLLAKARAQAEAAAKAN